MEYPRSIEALPRSNRASIAAASALVALTAASLVLPAPVPCGALARNYKPLIAFELARTTDDLHAIFGPSPSACRATLVAALDRVNVADIVAFIPAYTVFLCAWLLARRAHAPRAAGLGVALSLVAASGDLFENVCMFSLTTRLDAPSVYLSLLPWATALKWLSLAVVAGLVAVVLASTRPPRWVAALLHLPALVVTSLAIARPSSWGVAIVQGITLSWLTMLVVAIVDELRARRRES